MYASRLQLVDEQRPHHNHNGKLFEYGHMGVTGGNAPPSQATTSGIRPIAHYQQQNCWPHNSLFDLNHQNYTTCSYYPTTQQQRQITPLASAEMPPTCLDDNGSTAMANYDDNTDFYQPNSDQLATTPPMGVNVNSINSIAYNSASSTTLSAIDHSSYHQYSLNGDTGNAANTCSHSTKLARQQRSDKTTSGRRRRFHLQQVNIWICCNRIRCFIYYETIEWS